MTPPRPELPDWDGATRMHRTRRADGSWRRYCDALHTELATSRLRATSGLHLKTDLFDEATGAGVLPALSTRGWQVMGLDVAGAVAADARRRHPGLRCLRADVRALPFADRSVGGILSNSTLDHFRTRGEIDQALAELRRILTDDGRLLITLDNLDNPVVRLRAALPSALLQRLRLVPYEVGRTLTGAELRDAAGAAGFTVVELRTIMHVPRIPAMVVCRIADTVRIGDRLVHHLVRCLLAAERLPGAALRRRTGYYVLALAVPTPAQP